MKQETVDIVTEFFNKIGEIEPGEAFLAVQLVVATHLRANLAYQSGMRSILTETMAKAIGDSTNMLTANSVPAKGLLTL